MEFKVGDTVICIATPWDHEYDCHIGHTDTITRVITTAKCIKIKNSPSGDKDAAYRMDIFRHFGATKLERAIYNILD